MWRACLVVCVCAWAGGGRQASRAETLHRGLSRQDLTLEIIGEHLEIERENALEALNSPEPPQLKEAAHESRARARRCPPPCTSNVSPPGSSLTVAGLARAERRRRHAPGPHTTAHLNHDDAHVLRPPANLKDKKWQVGSEAERLAPVMQCGDLEMLDLIDLKAVRELPESFVARCLQLKKLYVSYASNLTRLPTGLLRNATELVELKLIRSGLETLPEDLLYYSPKLLTLDLRMNRLTTIPGAMFVWSRGLQQVSLSGNQLRARAVATVASLTSLTRLELARNAALGDLCAGPHEYSPFKHMRNLTYLSLARTNITCICRDWRDNMTLLTTLDMTSTKISILTSSELRYVREVINAVVNLKGAPVRSVEVSQQEYSRSGWAAEGRGAAVLLDSRLACDCRMYWTRRALPHLSALNQNQLQCAPLGRPLGELAPSEMQCPSQAECSEAGLPAACSCSRRPYNASGEQWLVTADCSGVSRGAVPALRPVARRYYRLLLLHNGISALPPAIIAPAVVEIDLRNNSIERVEGATAQALGGASHLKLWLAANPVDCTCAGDTLLQALHESSGGAKVADLKEAVCGGDLRPLGDALKRPPCLPPALWLAVALAAILTTAAALLAYFASPQRRLLLKALLYRWGLLNHPAAADEGCEFDAFVMSAAEDEAVAVQIARRLEGGPAPYRLCLNERDFVAGALISTQIEAAVQRSRRTVALVSRHLLACECLCVALREAQARAVREAAPRLVLVLLEAPQALPLGKELHQYIKAYTYVAWNHALFWDKLRMALRVPLSAHPSPPVSVAEKISADSSDSGVSSAASSTSNASASSTAITMPPSSVDVTPVLTWSFNPLTVMWIRDHHLELQSPNSMEHGSNFPIAVAT